MTLDKKSIMALVLLALGLLVAVPQLIPDDESTRIVDGELFEDEVAPASSGSGRPGETAEPSGPRVDLIAMYGSWEPGLAVSDPFGAVVADEALAEQPGADGPAPFPPVHHVSLVLLAGQVPRAVVDRQVVSLGDEIAAGRIVEMTATGLTVTSERFGRLDYDLGVPGARGYGAPPPPTGAAGDAGDAWWDDEMALDGPGRAPHRAPPSPFGGDFDAELEAAFEEALTADPKALELTAERMLQELYENIGSLPGGEEEDR